MTTLSVLCIKRESDYWIRIARTIPPETCLFSNQSRWSFCNVRTFRAVVVTKGTVPRTHCNLAARGPHGQVLHARHRRQAGHGLVRSAQAGHPPGTLLSLRPSQQWEVEDFIKRTTHRRATGKRCGPSVLISLRLMGGGGSSLIAARGRNQLRAHRSTMDTS